MVLTGDAGFHVLSWPIADSLCVTAAYLGFIIKTIPNMISENTTMSSVCVYGRYQNQISNSIPVYVLHIYCLFVDM